MTSTKASMLGSWSLDDNDFNSYLQQERLIFSIASGRSGQIRKCAFKAQCAAHYTGLDTTQPIHPAHAAVAQPAQRQGVGMEQPLEALHGCHHRQVAAHAAALVALQYIKTGDILTAVYCRMQRCGQLG